VDSGVGASGGWVFGWDGMGRILRGSKAKEI